MMELLWLPMYFARQSALDISAVPYGSGAHLALLSKTQILELFKLVYFWSIGMTRFAIVAFVPRICHDGPIKFALYGLAFINLVNTVTAFVFRLTECTPIGDNFNRSIAPGIHCVDNATHKAMNRAHAFIGLAIDVALLILPLWIVYTRMIFSKKTVSVLFHIQCWYLRHRHGYCAHCPDADA
ncbi:hypothetical protein BJ170DRAFT_202776 [Xylariales sp. AK1849]|nr:hypothetical protein BJ170DRAFT_202776 [Xylariales sp. AK1849]